MALKCISNAGAQYAAQSTASVMRARAGVGCLAAGNNFLQAVLQLLEFRILHHAQCGLGRARLARRRPPVLLVGPPVRLVGLCFRSADLLVCLSSSFVRLSSLLVRLSALLACVSCPSRGRIQYIVPLWFSTLLCPSESPVFPVRPRANPARGAGSSGRRPGPLLGVGGARC